jgi:hypothetical protein
VAQLYADENFSRPVVLLLRTMGQDVVTVQERGRDRSPDPDVLAQGTAEGRAVLTFNRKHFWLLHQSTPGHAGIVSCTEDDNEAALAARIDARLAATGKLAGEYIRVTKPHPSNP